MPRGEHLKIYIKEKKKQYDKLKTLARGLNLSIKGLWRTNTETIKQKTKAIQKTEKYFKNQKYKKYINGNIRQNNNIPIERIKKILLNLQRKRKILKIYNKTNESLIYPINDNTTDTLIKILSDRFFERVKGEIDSSDRFNNFYISEITKIKILDIRASKKNNKNGKFFKYINTTKNDLSKYQIYNLEQFKSLNSIQHCLFYTLSHYKFINKIALYNIINTFENGVYIQKRYFNHISQLIKKNIIIHEINKINKEVKTKYIYDDKDKEIIDIALYEGHYFIYEKINKISSLRLIHNLFLEGKFKAIDKIESINKNLLDRLCNFKNIKEDHDLNNVEILNEDIIKATLKNLNIEYNKEVLYSEEIINKLIKEGPTTDEPEIKNKKFDQIYYADCETFVHEQQHKLYMLGWVAEDEEETEILNTVDDTELNVINKFLWYISTNNKNVLVYFHNLKYDMHILLKHLNILSVVEKDNQFYEIKIKYKNCNIFLKDSYKLLSMPLSKFNDNFNLGFTKKEAIAYEYYTPENHNKKIDKTEYEKFLKEDEKIIFNENVKKSRFNPYKYYKEYLIMDCKVLKEGLIKFNKIINKIDGRLNIHNYLSISSLTDNYLKINGAYAGVVPVQHCARNYINKAIRGGRVDYNKKYHKKVIEGKISDFDGVSLYPSAIHRLCKERGLPKGFLKRFDKNLNWNNTDYCILTIKILEVNKNQQMPFISYKDDKGILQYSNEPPKENIIIDKYTLEDYINFHNIKYEIIDGLYWDNGFNKKMGSLIENLFNLRLENKKSNPALANVLKLMLNSAYGKSIIKQSFSSKVYKSTYDWIKLNNYIYNNYETIKKIDYLNKKLCMITQNSYDDSFNYGHVGCSILSYSKRIMNEVFNICNENKLPIYYTDTDSIHMNYDDINKLSDEYKKIYNKDLVGKSLGQFHNDFDLKGATSEIYATKSLFLGKKSYIDVLKSKNKEGKDITGIHYRLKGITDAGIKYESKKYNGIFNFYKHLARTKQKTEILLNPEGKVLFEYKKDCVITKNKFTRKVKF